MALESQAFSRGSCSGVGGGTALCVFTEAAQLPAQQALVQQPHESAKRERASQILCYMNIIRRGWRAALLCPIWSSQLIACALTCSNSDLLQS